MAERRMFTKKITDSDSFIELSSSAQALYFHLNQGADDDGFNNQVQNAMFKSHATIDDLKVLMMKNFIIRFESGVIVIKHWRLHNTLRKDRYTPTNFQEEFKMLGIKDNGSYELSNNGCQLVAKRLPEDSIGKNSIDKESIEYNKYIVELVEYLNEKAHTNFRSSTSKTQKLLKSLLKNYSVEEIKEVIDKKCLEWLGTPYEKYLRPETLFGNKFEGYLNAKVNVSINKVVNIVDNDEEWGDFL